MRSRSFLFGALLILCGLLVAALVLSSCDSGVDFSSLEDIAPNDGLTAKARAWYVEQVEIGVSENLSKIEGDEDSLALLAFIEKFLPDWNESVVLSLDGTEETLVLTTTLGEYTDERYDSTMYHIRTLVMNMEPSGDIVSGSIVAFSSEKELSKNDFANYVEQYVAKDFGEMEMTVSRYTVLFEGIDAYLYRPGGIPLELSIKLVKEQVDINQLDKFNSMNFITKGSTICYSHCYVSFGRTCSYPASDPSSRICGAYDVEVICSTYCFDGPMIGGGGDGSGGGGGNGGGDNGNDGDEEKCKYSQKICDLIQEYKDIGIAEYKIPSPNEFTSHLSGRYFTWNELNGGWKNGTEKGKHKPYGVFHSRLLTGIDNIREEYNQPIHLSSGYRCPQGNTDAGSEYPAISYHMFGRAADMTTGNSPIIFNKLNRIIGQVAKYLEGEPMSSYPNDGHLHLEYD